MRKYTHRNNSGCARRLGWYSEVQNRKRLSRTFCGRSESIWPFSVLIERILRDVSHFVVEQNAAAAKDYERARSRNHYLGRTL